MKVFFRTAALFTAFAIPLATNSCTKNEDKPGNEIQAVKPKEVLDKERIEIKREERKLALSLDIWSSHVCDVLIKTYMLTENPKEAIQARERAFKLIRILEDFINETGNNFDIEKPNEDQVEAFTRLISFADKSASTFESYIDLPLDTIASKIENYLRKKTPKLSEKEIQEEKKDELEYFVEYRKSYESASEQRANLLKRLETFNKDAQATSEPVYEPVWGLNIEYLKRLKAIK